jgi:glyoxylase-like metal-dependent hydrolase (beta-lactamase superfamily II)
MAHDWSWRLLRAGSFRLDGGGMFGVVPKTIWSKLVAPDDQNRIPLETNGLLLERSGKRVLIETGFGDKWTDKERGFYDLERRSIRDALREIGVEPESIDAVIVTHLHFDHAAGLTHLDAAGNPVSTFPAARIYVQKTEWEDAIASKSTMTRTYLRNHLDPVEPQMRRVEGETQVVPGVTVWPVPGHTWGQQAVRFDDGAGIVAFIGDVMPTVNHVGLSFSIGYDMLPYQNLLTKRSVLERAAADRWRIVLDHEPGDPVARVEPDASRPGQFVLRPA